MQCCHLIETKEKIKAYADFYNYKPNNLALQLRNQKTKVIGVILPKIEALLSYFSFYKYQVKLEEH